ncbi:hypothetical protein TPA0907_11250 [Micromonospora humidisoli]|uniref:Uncharacterized protein n=1 Tax=Micromonospora humidisoli TaxID=2807622 RepID=A0ABS2JEL2_9ACTN|nr:MULTISPECIES: hypothetical protein [Micromonospora]MBM7084016.1 hypothetical protein [Micromonospora humidisoli]GHJ06758.1 hypothetical protein TPA0907_11250 [Micromonospora sp. AKA109]
MTTAPANLLAVRRLLLDTIKGLDPAAVGIVGDPAHRGGYHCGSDRVVTNDYSVVESPRDSGGLTLYASGLDVGTFSVRSGGATHNLQTFSTWCVAQCRANTVDSRDLREIIYSPDGKVVRRWDRLGKRSSGDDSHLWHTHFSFFRDSTKAGRDQTPLFRRYLTGIGLLEDTDMTPEEHAWLETVHKNLTVLDGRNPVGQIYTRMAMGEDHTNPDFVVTHPTLKSLGAQLTSLQTALTALANKDFTDEQAIIAGVLAGLTPEKIAAAIPPTIAKQVADELAKRLVA